MRGGGSGIPPARPPRRSLRRRRAGAGGGGGPRVPRCRVPRGGGTCAAAGAPGAKGAALGMQRSRPPRLAGSPRARAAEVSAQLGRLLARGPRWEGGRRGGNGVRAPVPGWRGSLGGSGAQVWGGRRAEQGAGRGEPVSRGRRAAGAAGTDAHPAAVTLAGAGGVTAGPPDPGPDPGPEAAPRDPGPPRGPAVRGPVLGAGLRAAESGSPGAGPLLLSGSPRPLALGPPPGGTPL